MTHYATAKSIRKYTGIKVDDIPDAELEDYLTDGDDNVLDDISIARINDKLAGKIDGINTEYWCVSHPIADVNFDKTVNTLDVKVYKWGKEGSIDLREECTVSSINPHEGRIILSSAPANTFEVISMDYRFYPTSDTINWNQVEKAASLIAGYYYIFSEYLLIPERYARGAIRYTHAKPYYTLLDEYFRTIEKITTIQYAKKVTDETVLRRKLVEEMD